MRSVLLTLVLFSVICSGQSWQQLPDFPGTPRDDAAAFSIGENVYVGTGMEVGWGLTTDWYRFNGISWQWTASAPLPATARQYCSAFTFPGTGYPYGYLFGGLDGNGPLNELWRYDPATDSWTQMASLPGEPRYATVAFQGGYIATGLFVDGTATNELWKYDPASNTWQQLTSLPGTPRHRASSWTSLGLMVIGGADENYTALADCWEYNTSTDIWTASASLPEGRYSAMCSFAGYELALIGGATDTSTIVETGFSYYWTSWAPLSDPHPGGTRRGGVMVMIEGSTLTFLGLGLSNNGVRHNDWYVLDGEFGISENGISSMSIHPNPGTTTFTLQLPATLGKADLIVHDLSGRMILNAPLLSPTVDASAWPSGSYLIQVTSAAGDRYRARWVKLSL